MRAAVDQAGLVRALRMLVGVIPARTTLPILQSILMVVAEPGRLILRASNIELALATVLVADVESIGQAVVPGRKLTGWVSELPSGLVALVTDSRRGRLLARCGRFSSQLPTLAAEDFPTLPAADQRTAVDLDAAPLQAAISRVAFAAAPDDRRPVLAAIRFTLGANGFALAACDGFRLALACAPGGEATDNQFLVPARAIAALTHLLDGVDRVGMLVAPERRALHFLAGSSTLTVLLMEGTYPDVDRLVPSNWKTRVTAARVELPRVIPM